MDKEDCELFKNITLKLHETLNMYGLFIDNFDLERYDEQDVNVLLTYLEAIKSMIHIYERNKFASPGQCLSLINYVYGLEKTTVKFNKQLSAFAKYKSIIMKRMEQNQETYDDMSDNTEKLVGIMNNTWNALPKNIKQIEMHIDGLLLIIKYDVIRINTGVDIIRDYYATQKRIKLTGYDQFEYKISFVSRKQGGNKNESNGNGA